MAGRHAMGKTRWVVLAILGAILWGGVAAVPGQAQELDKLGTSVQWIPEDAAYYAATLRLGEQVQAVAQSRAWAALKDMPAVRKLKRTVEESMLQGEQAAQVKGMLENPEFRSALALLLDMFSQEVFFYGDRNSADVAELTQRLMNALRFGPIVAELTGQTADDPMERIQQKIVLDTLAENQELIKVPNVILGFKLANRKRAEESLTKLEGLINVLSIGEPRVNQYFKPQTVAGNKYLTVALRGDQIPWDQVPLDELRQLENRKGDVDKLVAKAKKMTLVVSLGLRDDYLLLAVGPNTDAIANLGKAEKKLIARPEFKPLEKFADRRLIAIQYVSEAMAAQLSNLSTVDEALKVVDQVLPKAKLTDSQKAAIRKDAAELAKDLKRLIPKPSAISGFAFIGDRGIESYTYRWGGVSRARQEPLQVLEHVGGRPILAVAAGCRVSIDDYNLVAKWLKTGHRYFEEYGVPQLDADEKEKYAKVKDSVQPLIERLDRANREMLIPSLGDAQCALVLDAKLKSRQFLNALPPTDQPLPMIEPALVLKLSDGELFLKALDEYRKIINDGIDVARKLEPNEVPEGVKVPEPQSETVADARLFYFPLPKEWGVTDEIVLAMGLAKNVASFAITSDHVRRLLKPTPPALGGLLAGKDRARVGAVAFNWAGLVDAATPWAEFGVREALRHNPELLDQLVDGENGQAAERKADEKPKAEKPKGKKSPGRKAATAVKKSKDIVMDQLHTVLKVLKTLRGVTMDVRVEGGALVSHSLTEIKDID